MGIGDSSYPSAIDTVKDLVEAANRAESTLSAGINSSVTTLDVASTSLFTASGIVVIDDEIIFYDGKNATQLLNCVRGREGTAAASHSSGAPVRQEITAASHNVLASAIIALENQVGLTGLTNGDRGDITVSANGATWTIDGQAVTLGKIVNIATDSLLGRDAAGMGSPEVLSVSGGLEFTGAGGIRTSAFTGDVTKTAGGTALTIANAAVTYAKMQNVSTGSLVLGRNSGAGAGSPQELTLTNVLDFVGSTQGDLLYRGASAWTRLPAGTSGRYLQTGGTGANPDWAFNYAFKNLIINGDMQIAQRSTSVLNITASGYNTADRWRTDLTTCGTWTQAVVADAPTGRPFRNSLRMTVTTAKTPAASDICRIDQRFEGQNLLGLLKGTTNARPLTLSFWVKGSITGTYIAELCDVNNNRQVSASYAIAVANTWEFKTVTFPADTTGTLTNDNNYSVCVGFWLAAGPNFRSGTLQTAWGNTAGNRAVGQVSVSATLSATWQVTGAQLEYGAVATDFECLPFHMQETLCERYLPRAAISNRQSPTNGQEHHFGGASPYANVGLIMFNFGTKARRDPTGVVLTLADWLIFDLFSGGYGPPTAVASMSAGFVNTTLAFSADSIFGGPLAFSKGSVLFFVPTGAAATRNIIFNGCEL